MEIKVIVSVNKNNNATGMTYDQLFARAYQALESKGWLKPEAEHADHTFHSIDEYYAHLEELYTIDKLFVMLPLDETPFAIDANKRVISAPKITVMQNDQNAEVVIFTVDRYFDFKDLDTALIHVQWTLPDGTEGASKVEMKDLSIPGKLRFGWSLDNRVTAQKGTVKYSVRFWNIGKIPDPNNPGELIDGVVYSLNTLTSTLTINESLQPELNDEWEVSAPIADGIFKRAIMNSQIYNENIVIPMMPYFEDPGLNLNKYESLTIVTNEDGTISDTLTLMAQAAVADTGEISYKWRYCPAETQTVNGKNFSAGSWYFYDDTVVDGVTVPGFSAYGGTVDNNYYQEVILDDDKLIPGEKYYVLSGDTYLPYDGSTASSGKRPTLYERYTTYTVPATGSVTGQYQVVATNTIGSNYLEKSSLICQLISPENVTFAVPDGDLEDREYFPTDANKYDLPLTLKVKTTDNTIPAPKKTYTWYYKRQGGGKDVAVEETVVKTAGEEGVVANEFKALEPGWYSVFVESTLNRETKSNPSTECVVTYDPVAPERKSDDETAVKNQLLTMEYTPEALTLMGGDVVPTYLKKQGDEVEFEVVMKLHTPFDAAMTEEAGPRAWTFAEEDDIYNYVDGVWQPAKEGQSHVYNPELFSENLSFKWSYQVLNGAANDLGEKDVGDGKRVISGLNTPKLKVRVLEGEDGIPHTYRCIVENRIDNKGAACPYSTALAFTVQ